MRKTFKEKLKELEIMIDLPDHIEIKSSSIIILTDDEGEQHIISINDLVSHYAYTSHYCRIGDYYDNTFKLNSIAEIILNIFKILNLPKLKKSFKENKYEMEL